MALKLFISHTSPFARTARVVAREKGLMDRLEEVVVDPFQNPAELIAANPAGLIPALERDDGGKPIIDSALIAAWLDHLPSSQPGLLPAGGPDRLAVRQIEALARTLTDKSVNLVFEKRRPAEQQFERYLTRWRDQAMRMIGALDGELERLQGPLSLGSIAAVSALAHYDFRHPEIDWRTPFPALAGWLDEMSARPSFALTKPQE